MIRNETIIGVNDVQKSSVWYQSLLDCNSNHGGNTFEILTDLDGTVILCLHKWNDHDHPTLKDPGPNPGNGLILYFRVNDLEKIWNNANTLGAIIEAKPAVNKNSGMEEFAIRDLDGYYILISL